MKLKFTWMLTLFLALVQFSFAQEKNISGTVSDESGMPLPGVAVLLKVLQQVLKLILMESIP